MRIFRPYLWLWWKKHMQIRCSLHFWIRSKEARINFCQWKKTDEQAQDKLEAKKVSGIYYVGAEPTLTVAPKWD